MFNKLREKLKNWTKGFSKKTSEEEIEEIDVNKIEKAKEEGKKLKKQKKKEEKTLKKEKGKKDKLEKEIEELEQVSEEIPELPEEIAKSETQKEIHEIEEIKTISELVELPEKFNAGTQKFEPDLEKLEEIQENLEENKKKSFFKRFASKINKVKISEDDFKEYSEELEMLLLENNVALEVAEKIIYELKLKLIGKEILKKEIESEIRDSFRDAILKILIEPFDLIEKIKLKKADGKPYIILFCGINGTGKTTTIAKIANMLKEKKLSPIMAAGDTFRAASIEQLKKHGEKLNVKVIAHEYGSDPASVGFDAVKYAEKNHIDVVLIDTAGRMHTEKNLMKEIEKIAKVTKPDCKIFVGESITGNDIVEQVKAFDDAINIDGIILSKADIDEKGGTALSVGTVTKKPILYLGVGQNYTDLEPFSKNKFVEKLGLDD